MSEEKGLMPVTQKEVVFYEDVITAVLVRLENKQQVYIPLRPICEYLDPD